MNNDKSAIQVIAGAARCPEYSPSMVKALAYSDESSYDEDEEPTKDGR